MQHLISLSDITFGKDDATIEARQGFLRKVFLKTSFYNRVRNGQKFLVTGRKGSGKSAICFYLIDALSAEGVNTIFATSRLLSTPKLQQLKNTSINEREKFESVWRYALLVKIAIKVIEIIEREGTESLFLSAEEGKQLKEVKLFLSRNNEIDKNLWQRVTSFFNILSKISAKLPGGVETGIETRQIETVRDLSNMLDKFEESILCLINKSRIFKTAILVDEIDDIWDQTQDSKSLIIGLLDATNKLNASLSPSAMILVFLRSDIWDSLGFTSKDKYRSSDERISWTEDDLKHLITNRAMFSANLENRTIVDSDLWSIFFEDKVKNQSSFNYIVNRTLKRPREVIQFCNLALSVAQDHGNLRITEKDILAAESTYSVWKLDDLSNEFSVQYPFLRDALSMFDGFQTHFSKSQVDVRFESSRKVLSQRFPEISDLDLNTFLQILFGVGFIGAQIEGKDIYLHDEPNRPRIVFANLVDLEKIVIHPAFHSALGLSKYSFDNINVVQVGRDINFNVQISGGSIGNILTGDKVIKVKPDDSKPSDK
jgi:hypothetical protein